MGQITVRLPDTLHAALRDRAAESSLNAVIVDALTEHVDTTYTRLAYASAAHSHGSFINYVRSNGNDIGVPRPPSPPDQWLPTTWTITTGDVTAAVDAIRPGTPWRLREALHQPIATASTITTSEVSTIPSALHAAACITTGFARGFPLARNNHLTGLACGLAVLTTCGIPLVYGEDTLNMMEIHLRSITASPAAFNDLVPQVSTLLDNVVDKTEGPAQ